jgi:ribose transport system substrate-binding protein
VATAKAAVVKALQPPTQIGQTVPLPSKAVSGKSIIFVSNGLPATAQIAGGVQQAAKAAGWSYSTAAYDAANPSTLQAALRTALQKKPTVVAEAGTPQTQFGASTIAAYAAAGVPIIEGSTFPISASQTLIAGPAGGASEQSIGKTLADWFIADSNGKGTALLESVTAFPVLLQYANAFRSEVSRLCPGCSVKTIQITAAQVGSGALIPAVVSDLRANPTLKYVFFDNGEFADGIVSALSAAGITNVKIGGRSMDAQGLAEMQQGKESAWTGSSYSLQGNAIMDTALRWVMKAPGAANNIVIPHQLITQANAAQTKAPYALPADGLAQYKKLWRVS